jgi:hypothetical protein
LTNPPKSFKVSTIIDFNLMRRPSLSNPVPSFARAAVLAATILAGQACTNSGIKRAADTGSDQNNIENPGTGIPTAEDTGFAPYDTQYPTEPTGTDSGTTWPLDSADSGVSGETGETGTTDTNDTGFDTGALDTSGTTPGTGTIDTSGGLDTGATTPTLPIHTGDTAEAVDTSTLDTGGPTLPGLHTGAFDTGGTAHTGDTSEVIHTGVVDTGGDTAAPADSAIVFDTGGPEPVSCPDPAVTYLDYVGFYPVVPDTGDTGVVLPAYERPDAVTCNATLAVEPARVVDPCIEFRVVNTDDGGSDISNIRVEYTAEVFVNGLQVIGPELHEVYGSGLLPVVQAGPVIGDPLLLAHGPETELTDATQVTFVVSTPASADHDLHAIGVTTNDCTEVASMSWELPDAPFVGPGPTGEAQFFPHALTR